MRDTEMIDLDDQARQLARKAAELLEAGNTDGANACIERAVEKMQQVAAEMSRRHDEIVQMIADLKPHSAQSAD